MVAAAIAWAILLSAVALDASTPKFFQAATQADFLKGDVENLSIDTHGQLTLGLATELVYETAAPFLWSMATQPDGTMFIGTGNEGKVFRVDPQGRGSVFFDSTELEAHALALAPNGGLYVGTSPDGKIYSVDRNGTGRTFFSPDDKYIWALAVDAKGNLFAGTGDKGVIYKITADGKGTIFYKTNATHATALAFDKAGNLFVGTGTPGRVLRIDPEGKPFVLLDSPKIASIVRAPRCLGSPCPRSPLKSRRSRSSMSAVDPGSQARLAKTAGRQRAPSSAFHPTASGISCGNRATTRPTISPSIVLAPSSSPPGTKGRCTGWRANRCAQRFWREQALSRSRRSIRIPAAGCTTPPPTPANYSGCRPTGRRAARTNRRRATLKWWLRGAR